MNNQLIQIKVKQRLNKLDSSDYTNIECWQIQEAFNKAQIEWVRRQIHAMNAVREGMESSTRRITDLDVILNSKKIPISETLYNYVSIVIPEDFMEYKRLSIVGSDERCRDREMVAYLAQESDVDILMNDELRCPSFEWAETFLTLIDGHLRIYKTNEFDLSKPILTYYRMPRKVVFKDCIDVYSQMESSVDVTCEFKDDIVELIISDTVAILAGDTESTTQYQINSQSSEKNN